VYGKSLTQHHLYQVQYQVPSQPKWKSLKWQLAVVDWSIILLIPCKFTSSRIYTTLLHLQLQLKINFSLLQLKHLK
jgi:hypothetical protein